MKQRFATPVILFTGILLSQLGFTLLVHTSNLQLLTALKAIHETGTAYIVIPSGESMNSLGRLSTAFNGGLFFTFTLGAAMSVAAFAWAWLWLHFLGRNRKILSVVIICWVGYVATVIAREPQFIIGGILLFVPTVVFLLTWMLNIPRSMHASSFGNVLHILLVLISVIVLKSFVGTAPLGSSPFSYFRDTFLFSNPAGMVLNDFYYKYTLHAARVFKTLDQKIVNTCFIDTEGDDGMYERLERILVAADFFPVDQGGAVDLTIKQDRGTLLLNHGKRRVIQCRADDFLTKPRFWLGRFSLKLDPHGRLRQMIYISLVAGLPVFTYLLWVSLLQVLFSMTVFPENTVRMGAHLFAFFCVAVLMSLVAYHSTRQTDIRQNLAQSLKSSHVSERIAALKTICREKINIADFQAHGRRLQRTFVVERYWTARALAFARGKHVATRLVDLLDDPHPNVVCQALYALGKRGDKRFLPEIMHRITTTDHWYIQWYGYRAAKQLGWKQIELN